MTPEFPSSRDLVLIGGGHTHALVLRRWGMSPLAGARLTVINPGPTAPYSGMLPGFVAGHYTREELDIDLVRLARFAGARLIDGAVTGIDRAERTITVPGRPPIAYDLASIDIGITSAMPDLPGFAEHGVPAKPLGSFSSRWERFRTTASDPRLAIIGGGVAGAELAMAMTHALRAAGQTPQVTLIDRGRALAALGHTARQKMRRALDRLDVTLQEGVEVAAVRADHVHLADGTQVASDFTTGAAGARPQDWMAQIGVDLHDGFLAVDATLRTSDPTLFAVGDCAHLSHAPRPKAGVFAVRQAPVLFDNLRAALSGGALRPYTPQRDYLKLISLGSKNALAEKFGTARSGPLLWRWKNHIDRKFMAQFAALEMMSPPKPPITRAEGLDAALGDKPMCGGCGAKAGRGALGKALATLPQVSRDDVEAGPGDDAGILRFGKTRQVISTDHLRAFWADPVVMARIATHHALGDVWSMGATPQAATLNLILPRMPTDLQTRTLTEITAAVGEVLAGVGAAIVGGHTSLGAELTIGLTVTGLLDGPPITLAGAQPRDVLILTKPLGSGVIMAAEMAGKAKGGDVLAALAHMQEGQGPAAACLQAAHALTDVTGFGLAGHLDGMCTASGLRAEIDLAAIPLLPGAEELAGAGHRSSLFADNRRDVSRITGPEGPRFDLLFDPQTSGGLLAAVATQEAAATLAALTDAGVPAADIGKLVAGPPGIAVT